jgi:hypothetical protein
MLGGIYRKLSVCRFRFYACSATDHTIFPSEVLTLASKDIKSSQDNREVLKLAETGWKSALQAHRAGVFKEYVGKLNTPKPEQVDLLFSTSSSKRPRCFWWHFWWQLDWQFQAKRGVARLTEILACN